MERIKEFTVLSVKMEGFKRFREAFEVELNTISYVFGANGQGKSSIADAIAYAFCGVPAWGEKSCDRLLNQESDTMKVTVTFADGDGELHTLSRSRNRSGKESVIVLDNCPMKQTDMTSLFAEKDIFLSIFNPLYFIEKIAEGGNALLLRLLPPVKREEVFRELSEHIQSVLINESFQDPAYYIKKKREELRELEEAEAYTKGQIDLMKLQLKEAEKNIDEVIQRGEEMIRRKEALEEKQFRGIDTEQLRQRQKAIAGQASDTERQKLLSRKAELLAKQFVSPFTRELDQVKSELKMLYTNHARLSNQMKAIQPGNRCPACKTLITEENYPSIIREFQKEILENSRKGKSAKSAYDELLETERKSREKFEEFRASDLKKTEEALAELENGDISEIAMLEDQIRMGNLSQEEFDELVDLQKKALEYAKEVETLCKVNRYPEEIQKLEGELRNTEQEKASVKTLIQAAGEYAAKRSELSLKSLKMNHAAIKLFDIVKTTGEMKNVFQFTYDGKDYRWLSNSEKIKAGLEVAQLLQNLTGLIYPTYVDNAEGITAKLDRISGQVICAFARKGELNVQAYSQNQVREAA